MVGQIGIKNQAIELGAWSVEDKETTRSFLNAKKEEYFEPNAPVCLYAFRQTEKANLYQIIIAFTFPDKEGIELDITLLSQREFKISGQTIIADRIEILVRAILIALPTWNEDFKYHRLYDLQTIPFLNEIETDDEEESKLNARESDSDVDDLDLNNCNI